MTEGIIGAVVGLLLIAAGYLFGTRANKGAVEPVVRPPKPKHTATEHENASVSDAIEAVVQAADDHGVEPGVVADDLDWLESGDL